MENNTSLVINGLTAPSTVATITPAVINTNIDALNAFVDQLAKSYEIVQYSDNLEEQKKQMKEDRANLNKLSSAIDKERIRIKKEASKEIDDFDKSYKNLVAKIEVPCQKIDNGIKALEKKQRDDKLLQVNAIWEKEAVVIEDPDVRSFLYEKLYSEKFLNVTTSAKSIRDSFASGIKNYTEGMETLEALDSEFKEEGITRFKSSLDLTESIGLINRLTQQQKEAEERLKAKLEAEKQEAIRKAEEKARREEREKAEAEKRAALEEERKKMAATEAKRNPTQMSFNFTSGDVSFPDDFTPVTPASNHPNKLFSNQVSPSNSSNRRPKVFIKIENGQISDVFSGIDIDVEILDVDTVMDQQELIDFAKEVENKNCRKVC